MSVRQARRSLACAQMGILVHSHVQVLEHAGVDAPADPALHLMVAQLRLHHGRAFVLDKSFCFVVVGALHLKGRFVQQRAVVLDKHTPRHVAVLDIALLAGILGVTFVSKLSRMSSLACCTNERI